MNQVLFGHEARVKVKQGLDIVAGAVRTTLGPAGRNVLIERDGLPPQITNDGVTVARSIHIDEPNANLGATLIREVAEKTDKSAGDGTTTATVIAHEIATQGMKLIERGFNPIYLREGIEMGKRQLVDDLKKMARPVSTVAELTHVATISSENEEMGRKVAEVVHKIGKDGVVAIEESPVFGIHTEFIDGMKVEGGFIHDFMVTNKKKRRAELENCSIVVTDRYIESPNDMVPVMSLVGHLHLQDPNAPKNLVVFCLNADWPVLELFFENKMGDRVNVVAIKVPEINHEDHLADIAACTGATFIKKGNAMKLADITVEQLGYSPKVVAESDTTTIAANDAAPLTPYIEALKGEMEADEQKTRERYLKRRIARLQGGIAVIRLGAATESELSYLYHKLEDTISATQAALEEGVVPGGGAALAKAAGLKSNPIVTWLASHAFSFLFLPLKRQKEIEAGRMLMLRAVEKPLLQIVENAGRQKPEHVLYAVKRSDLDFFGYDAKQDRYVNTFAKGILDPLKVTQNALEKAVSIAGLLLTTEVSVTIKR